MSTIDHWMAGNYGLPAARNAHTWARRQAELGVRAVYIPLNYDGPRRFELIYDRDRYAAVFDALAEVDRQIILMPWLHRDARYQEDVARACDPWVERYDAWMLYNAEATWHRQKSVPLAQAVATFARLTDDYEGPVGVVGVPVCPPSIAALADHCAYAMGEALSIYDPVGKPYTTNPIYRPGTMQRASFRSYARHFRRVVLQLPLYEQQHPAPHPKGLAAIRTAAETAHAIYAEQEERLLAGEDVSRLMAVSWWRERFASSEDCRTVIREFATGGKHEG